MLKVLLADDEKVISEGLEALIDWEALGFFVCASARSGAELLELNDKWEPHLIITDIKMPKMNGIDALFELRRRGCAAEALLLTGYADFEYARGAIDLGSCGYLLKPVDDEDLTRRLKHIKVIVEKKLETNRAPAGKPDKEEDMGVVGDVIDFLKEKYREKISLRTASERFYINSAYLGQLFKRKMNISFHDYLTQLRMDKAKQLLLSSAKSISEISYEVGFEDPNYFSSRFAKAEGMSPREYRIKGEKPSVTPKKL